ncbi:META domain-containing protein [Methylophaga frappieri]|nr:META domain-containing protein [Methylophaga frappieri]
MLQQTHDVAGFSASLWRCVKAGFISFFFFITTACDATDTNRLNQFFGESEHALPVSFSGTLPCADCPGIDYRLNLFADQSFFLRMRYQDRSDADSYYLGRWQWRDDATLILLSEREIFYLAADSRDQLTLLNKQGHPIQSALNSTLIKDEPFLFASPVMAMRGQYRFEHNQGIFQECATGQHWMVLNTPEAELLQQRYQAIRKTPAQSLLVTLHGELEPTPEAKDSGDQLALKVTQFAGIWPGETCGQLGAQEILLDTYWKLTRLMGKPVTVVDNQREPSLIMASGNSAQVTGYDGCNQIIGTFNLQQEALSFNKMATTMKACPEGMASAKQFHDMLVQVQSWSITNQYLELNDANGTLLARFQAVHF